MVFCAAGLLMILVWGVSIRMLPLLDREMRDADCVGGPPPGGCVFVEHSEQQGGLDGVEGICTVRQFITADL